MTLLLLAFLLTTPLSGATAQSGRNVYGIQTLVPTDSASQTPKQLAWARALVGPNGHVTQPFHPVDWSTQEASAEAVAFVEQAYALGINPIIRLQGAFANGSGCDPNEVEGWLPPLPDDPESLVPSYTAEAEGFARFVAGLPKVEGRPLYVQIWNEPNLHYMWGGEASPAQYARFFVDVAAAIRALGDDRIKILNAALAPEGDVDNLRFIQEASAAEPAFLTSFDYWSSHPYPHNQPPANNLHAGTALPGSRYTIDAYLLELDVLKQHEVDTSKLQVVLTETGYRLEDDWYSQYPSITEENRAEYMRQAFDQYWSQWPEILTVTPFQLMDSHGSWDDFDWIWSSSSTDNHGFPTQPHLQYAKLLQGVGLVSGAVTDERGKPLRGVSLTTDVNGHKAVSLGDGTFIMIGYPGTYRITAEKSGYVSSSADGIVISQGGTATLNLSLTGNMTKTPRNPSIESGDLSDWTTWGAADGVQQDKWFFGITPYDGHYFLGSAANCMEKDGGFFQTMAATPGKAMRVSAWLLTQKDGDAHMASRLGVDPLGGSDPSSVEIVWSPWTRTGGDWRQVTVSLTPRADRITIFLEHDQHIDNPWNVNAFDRIEIVEEE